MRRPGLRLNLVLRALLRADNASSTLARTTTLPWPRIWRRRCCLPALCLERLDGSGTRHRRSDRAAARRM